MKLRVNFRFRSRWFVLSFRYNSRDRKSRYFECWLFRRFGVVYTRDLGGWRATWHGSIHNPEVAT